MNDSRVSLGGVTLVTFSDRGGGGVAAVDVMEAGTLVARSWSFSRWGGSSNRLSYTDKSTLIGGGGGGAFTSSFVHELGIDIWTGGRWTNGGLVVVIFRGGAAAIYFELGFGTKREGGRLTG